MSDPTERLVAAARAFLGAWEASYDGVPLEISTEFARAIEAAATPPPPAAATPTDEPDLDDVAAIYARDAKDEDGNPDHFEGLGAVWCAGHELGYTRGAADQKARGVAAVSKLAFDHEAATHAALMDGNEESRAYHDGAARGLREAAEQLAADGEEEQRC